uniref:Fanconi anemia group I protein n=1 Tax=Steinernema glaseri TaxID=37863 RepID=A0A1I7YWZ1_9BILA
MLQRPHETLQRLREQTDANYVHFMDVLTTLIPLEDFVIQSLSTILHSDRKLLSFMRKSTNQKYTLDFMNRLDSAVHEACHRSSKVDSERLVVLLAFILSSNMNKLISGDKLGNWIKFLTTFDSSLSPRHYRAALSAICACNLNAGSQFESSVTLFFQQLKNLVFADPDRYSALNQLMLLLAMHFNKKNEEQINQLLSSELGFKVSVYIRGTNIRTLYLRHAMSEKDVAESAANISVTRSLTEHISGYLPAHCINHLLLGKIFSKHRVAIQAWIQAQLLECKEPVHPIVGELLSSYAASCVPSPESPSCNFPLDEDFLRDVFSGDIFDASKRVTRILCMHFIFAYTHEHHKFMKNVVKQPKKQGNPSEPKTLSYTQLDNMGWHRRSYTDTLLPIIPVRYLLSVIEAAPRNYRPIRAKLMNTVAHFMPYMMPDMDALLTGDSAFLDGSIDVLPSRISSERLIAAFDEIERTGDNTAACQLLSHLEHASLRTLSKVQTAICYGMRSTLDERTSEWVVEVVTNLWQQLELVQTRRLYDETIKKWIEIKKLNSQAVIEQPLLLFRCDKRVLQSAHHLQCLLRMLNFFLSACHANFHIKREKARKDDEDDPARLMHALIGAQFSAIVQILIGICDKASERVQKVIGSQIHRMFIAEPQVSRLVHYQTYPLHLVPVVVKHVPSMHIMIEHVQELFVSPKIQRRIFGVVLMVELAHQYKIPAALTKIELILDVIHTLITYVSTDYNMALFLSIVPSLSRLMKLFPQVTWAVTGLLTRMSMIAQARGAIPATVVHKRKTPERKLIEMIERELGDSAKQSLFAK